MIRYIDEITFREYRGVKEVVLANLGHINVLVGKNGSGKTTLLEALQNPLPADKDFIEFKFYTLTQAEIVKLTKPYFDSSIKSKHQGGVELMVEKFEDFINQGKPVITKNCVTGLIENFDTTLSKSGQPIEFGDHQLLRSILSDLFNLKPELISPKRQFQFISSIDNNGISEVDSNRMILNLFRHQNQPANTEKRVKFERLRERFASISDGKGFTIRLIEEQSNIELNFSDDGRIWYPANKCGLGIFDLLVILYVIEFSKANVLCIEEPENHLHPDIQRKLLSYISTKKDKQFFISTHSNIFLDLTFANRIFQTIYDNGEITVLDGTSRASLLQDLGYSVGDNLTADLVILVEGPSDKPVLEEFFAKLPDLDQCNIKIWALGGDIMSQQDISVFTENYKVLALIDKDPKSDKIRKGFVQQCEALSVKLTKLDRYAIENYFSLDAIRSVFVNQIPETVTVVKPEEKLEKQIGLNVKKKNRQIAKVMTLEEIEGTDLYEFLKKVEGVLVG